MNKSKKTVPREVWIGWFSSAAEAYNMAIFSFIAPLLATIIFKQESSWNAVFFSYSLVLVGSCLLYPAGALYYGFVGDKRGRQKTCLYSTLGLALATGVMGLVPFQWVFFLILICAQNFFSGGEYYGSIVFSLEHGKESKAGIMSSLSCLFAVFGLIAANGLATLSIAMNTEFWIRVCFVVGGAGGLIGYVLKNYCQETPEFCAIPKESLEKVDWINFVKSSWRKIVSVITVFSFFIVSFMFIFIFLPLLPFAQTYSQHLDTFNSLIVYGLLLVGAGWLADRTSIKAIMLTGACLFSIVIMPLAFWCSNLLVFQLILTLCASLVIGPLHSWMIQQFEANQRCRGVFMGSGISTALWSGSTVPLCLLIHEQANSVIICCLFPLIFAIVAVFCIRSSR